MSNIQGEDSFYPFIIWNFRWLWKEPAETTEIIIDQLEHKAFRVR
jgi:hypothetical protein